MMRPNVILREALAELSTIRARILNPLRPLTPRDVEDIGRRIFQVMDNLDSITSAVIRGEKALEEK